MELVADHLFKGVKSIEGQSHIHAHIHTFQSKVFFQLRVTTAELMLPCQTLVSTAAIPLQPRQATSNHKPHTHMSGSLCSTMSVGSSG